MCRKFIGATLYHLQRRIPLGRIALELRHSTRQHVVRILDIVRGLWMTLLATAVILLVGGCSSGDSADRSSASARLLSPAAFAAELDRDDRFLINVHVPDEGSIAGTDAAIPFDQIERRASDVPQGRSTPLAVYCRTGSMSAIAIKTLAGMGYEDIVELQGGMVAWEADGRALLPPSG